MDENGTLDLSMKKPIKREGSLSGASPGMRSPDPSSSSSSSVHHSGITSPNLLAYKQEEWEGPLDYTKPHRQREEDAEEVRSESFYLPPCSGVSGGAPRPRPLCRGAEMFEMCPFSKRVPSAFPVSLIREEVLQREASPCSALFPVPASSLYYSWIE